MSAPNTSKSSNATSNNVVDENLKNALEECCEILINDRARSNYVKPSRLRRMDPMKEYFDGTMKNRIKCRRIRYALQAADYAEDWGEQTFRLLPDKFPDN